MEIVPFVFLQKLFLLISIFLFIPAIPFPYLLS